MKPLFYLLFLTLPLAASFADAETDPETLTPTAPYLLPGSPTFDLSISQFDVKGDKVNLTRAASKINENLYASTALERGTLKIKSIQMTWLPIQGPEQKAAKAKALEYMAALLRSFTPKMGKAQSQQRLTRLLTEGKGKRYFSQAEGAIRYVVADSGEKGLTFAVEPIKLALSATLEGSNK